MSTIGEFPQPEPYTGPMPWDERAEGYAPDIVAFLEARLAEIEVLAHEAKGHPSANPWHPITREDNGNVRGVWDGTGGALMSNPHRSECEHVVFWQPDRALALVASYRRIIERHTAYSGAHSRGDKTVIGAWVALGEVLIDLASLWREHPDWHETWEVEDR